MKTAISLPDDLFARAERTAKQLGIPRSQLFARAVHEYLSRHDPESITTRINESLEHEHAGLDAALTNMQSETINRINSDESW